MDERNKQRNDELRGCVSVSPYFAGGDRLMASWNAICDRAEKRVEVLARQLRGMNVRAVHPNDGWVKRNDGIPYEVFFCYPDFIDAIKVGDKIALKRTYEKRLNNVDVVELFEVIEYRPWFDRMSYGIEYSGERFIYHEDGTLESTGYINKDYDYYKSEVRIKTESIISKIKSYFNGGSVKL